jgi:hypothetical protein
MPRVSALEQEQTTGEARKAFDAGMARWKRMTNMKRTLLHHPLSYNILMEWYTLFDAIKPYVGERNAIIFAHAVSVGSGCLICTTFMRRILIDWGDNPNELKLDEKGQALVDFGCALSKQGNRVPDNVYKKMTKFFNDEQIVAITAFGAMMVATNIMNNVLEVELDDYLYSYRDGQPLPKKPAKAESH